MVRRITACLRQNVWVLMASFLAFASAAFVGSLTVDSGTSTPAIWLATIWAMIAVGALMLVLIVIECMLSVTGDG